MTFFPSFSRRARVNGASRPRDANVAVIMVVMMSLVFAPIIAIHLVATFSSTSLSWTLLTRSAETALPRG